MENKVLAIAAGQEIKESDVEAVIKSYPAQQQMMLNTEEGKQSLLNELISVELFNAFGKELKLDETDEYKDAIEGFKKQLIASLTMNKILKDITVTDEEAEKFYNDNKEAYKLPATVTASHILVDSEEKALEVKKEIDGGLSFVEAAKKYSSCPSKEQGGNLGAFSKGMMVPEFEKAAFAAEIGKITDPVKSSFGYHLVLVTDKEEASERTFEEVKSEIVNQLIKINQNKKYTEQVKELEEKFGVERK